MSDWTNDQRMDENDRADIGEAMLSLWCVWGAQLAALVVLVVISHVLGPQMRERTRMGDDSFLGMLQIVIGIVSAFSLVIAWYLRKSLLGGKFRLFQNICAQMAAARKMAAYIVKYRAAVLIAMAIPPSVGIYGFILSMFGAANTVFYGFIIVSALALIWQRPRREELIALGQTEVTEVRYQKTEPEA